MITGSRPGLAEASRAEGQLPENAPKPIQFGKCIVAVVRKAVTRISALRF